LLAQEKNLEAAPYARKLAEAWKDADLQPTSSCFCAPALARR